MIIRCRRRKRTYEFCIFLIWLLLVRHLQLANSTLPLCSCSCPCLNRNVNISFFVHPLDCTQHPSHCYPFHRTTHPIPTPTPQLPSLSSSLGVSATLPSLCAQLRATTITYLPPIYLLTSSSPQKLYPSSFKRAVYYYFALAL